MPKVLLPNHVRTVRRFNHNPGVSFPAGINAYAPPWVLDNVPGQSCTVGHYKRWNEGWTDDDGIMEVFRGGVTFSIDALAGELLKREQFNKTHIQRATLHFSLLAGALQTGSYDNPVVHLGAVPSVLQTISQWKTNGDFETLDLFNENTHLNFANSPGGAKSPVIPWFDAATQARPMGFHMEQVVFPKVPPIHIPGTPIVSSQLQAKDVVAFRMNPNGRQPCGEYWVDVTDYLAQTLDQLTMALWPYGTPSHVHNIGFILGKLDQDIGDPNRDFNNVQASLYGNFKLAVYP